MDTSYYSEITGSSRLEISTAKDELISVLYVDDEPHLLEIGKIFLEKFGFFHVDIVSSVPLALENLNNANYDAIISDYQMPDMSGIDFLKYLRSSGNLLPFIIFTSTKQKEVVIEALNEGADFYVQKGGDPSHKYTELANKICKAISHHKSNIKNQCFANV
ncbi:MAG: response regulator [Methanomicrobiaceae archaeon]|nr:response regulator [Methanomicrobiaceae archaeon]